MAEEKDSAETQWEATTVIQEEMVATETISGGDSRGQVLDVIPRESRPALKEDFYIGDRLCDEEKTPG